MTKELKIWKAVIVAAIFLAVCRTECVYAEEYYGDWRYEADGVVVTLTGYTGSASEVVVPDYINGKTVICLKGTFYQNKRIKKVTIPSTVQRIEAVYTEENGNFVRKETFGECSALTTVKGGNGVFAYAEGTFRGCSSLRNVTLANPDHIPGQMFYGCKSLTSIRIPDTVRKICYQAFWDCTKLKTVRGGWNVTTYEAWAFRNCTSLQNITIGRTKTIPEFMFYNCRSLKKILLPSTLIDIQKAAFAGTALQEVYIPDSVQYIGGDDYDEQYGLKNGAFFGCMRLKRVKGCKNLRVLGIEVFRNCKNLQKVDSLGKIGEIKQMTFSGCSSLQSVKVPSSVRKIGIRAFYGCKKLKQMKLPSKLAVLGTKSFAQCKSLKALKIPASVKQVTLSGEDNVIQLVSKPTKLKVYKGSYAARVCPDATKITAK